MAQQIDVPGVGVVEFPDEMSDDQISTAIKRNLSMNQVAPKTGKDAMPDFLREEMNNASPFIRNLAGAGTALSDLWEGAKQLVGKGNAEQIGYNKVMGDEAPVGKFVGNAALTAIPFGLAGNTVRSAAMVGAGVGALEPISGDQGFENVARGKLINAGLGAVTAGAGQKVANVAGDYVAGKLADLAAKKAQNAPLTKTLQDALDAGLVVPPSSVNPSAWNTMREGVAGKIATAQTASNRNAPVMDNLARKAIGLAPDEPLTSEATQLIRKQAYQTGYAPIEQLGTIPTDATYTKALDALMSKHQGASRSFPGAFADDVTKAIEPLKQAAFDAGDALKATQVLRDEAGAAFRAGDNALGHAKKGAAKAIEDQIERSLPANSPALQNFRDARKLMAKSHTVEDAIVEGGGTIDPRKLATRFQAGKPLEGELRTIGAFAKNFPKATQPTSQVAGPGVSKLNSAMATGAGIAGFAAGGPVGIGASVLPFVVPPAVRSVLLSGSSQRNQLAQLYKLGVPTRTANALLQYAPVGGTVAGLNAFAQ